MNNDLISRSELKKAILKHCRSEIEAINHFWYDDTIITLIDNAPTVEERPQGKWMRSITSTYCLNCDYHECNPKAQELLLKFNFCPNCGAKMGGTT